MSKQLIKKEPVKLRQKVLANGNLSLYLDIYKDGVRSYEFLKLYLQENAKTPDEKQANIEIYELAQRIKAKRIEELLSGTFGIPSKTLSNTNFVSYYYAFIEQYKKKDIRTLKGSYNKFKEYLLEVHSKEKLLARELTENIVIGFKDYLEAKLNGETPLTYFNRFRKVILYAYREHIFSNNPIPKNLKFKSHGLTKDILSLDEISLLAKTYCGNQIVKRAFLFSCNTGLRFGDLVALKWQNIQNDYLKIKLNKTEENFRLVLNSNALKLIGEKKEEDQLVFQLTSYAGSAKVIKNWVARASITKRITWHSARHSFATNILYQGYDVKTLSKLLGHTSTKHTEKYLSIVDERKVEAVTSLPEIDFELTVESA